MIKFLENIGRSLGAVVDNHPKKLCLKELSILSKNPYSEIDEVWDCIFRGLVASLPYVDGIIASRIFLGRSSIAMRAADLKNVVIQKQAGESKLISAMVKRLDTYDPVNHEFALNECVNIDTLLCIF